MNSRKYHIIIGSKDYFNSKLPVFDENDDVRSFLELVILSDECKRQGRKFDDWADILVLKNDNYHGITEQAHDRVGAIIDEVTEDNADIYIHNPPMVLLSYIENAKKQYDDVELTIEKEKYSTLKDSMNFVDNMKSISKNIVGQNNAIAETSKSMWYLTKINRKKPYVIMLYGSSSIGKTELVREISNNFFDGKLLEKHLSMFKNNTYSDYFFGEKPNRRSLGYELLERESNLIFLDELDKCPEHFYSAFYTLFDNVIFKDSSYEVDTSGLLIVLTSNYQSKKEMQKMLGLPIYYRIDKFIHFEDFDGQTIYDITMKEIESRYEEYKDIFTPQQIYAKVSVLIQAQGENARTIKYKVQEVIEDLLFQDIQNKFNNVH